MASLQKKEETNWNRACRLLLEGGRHVLISFLKNFWTSNLYSSLDAFLATHHHQLTSPPASRHIHPPQINILFPASGHTITDKWDITLAAAVVHSCVPHKTPKQWASLNDIRELRNNVHGHGLMEMTDAVFTTTWADVNNTLAQAAVNFHLTPTQSDLKVKSDRIKKDVIVDGDEMRKELNAWYLSDILQGQTDISEVIRQGTIVQKEATTCIKVEISKAAKEQKDATTDIKVEISKAAKEQKDATTDIKEEISKAAKEQKDATTDIKVEISKAAKEQKDATTDIKEEISKAAKEQKDARSDIKAEVRKVTKAQKEATTDIKAEIKKGTKEQKEATTDIKEEISKAAKEQKDARSDINEEISKAAKEQKDATTDIKVEISKAAKEQKDATTEIKEEISKATKEQKDARSDIKEEISKAAKEQKDATTDMKVEISKAAKEQKDATTDIKEEISKAAKEQKDATTDIKVDISKATKEQKDATTDMKEEISIAAKEQKDATTDIKVEISKAAKEQKEATTDIKEEISKAAKEQKDATTDMKEDISIAAREQKDATTDIKVEISKAAKEQKEATTDIKEKISKAAKEQKDATTDIKVEISKATKEQKDATTDIKEEISKATKEQKEGSSDINKKISKLTEEQRDANNDIKGEIRKVTKEQNFGIKTVMDQLEELKTGQEHILQKVTPVQGSKDMGASTPSNSESVAVTGTRPKCSIPQKVRSKALISSATNQSVDIEEQLGTQLPPVTLAQSSKAHGKETPDTYKSQSLTGTRPKCSIPQPPSRKKSNISSSRLPIKKVVDSKEKVRSKVFTSSVTNQRVNFEQQPRTLFPVATDQRVDIEPLSGTQFPLATNQPVDIEPPSMTQFPLATNHPVESEQQPGTKLPPELQSLQSNLVDLYRANHVMSPLVVHSSSSQADIDAIYAKPHLVLVYHRALTKESSKEENIAYADMFQQNVDRCHQIYISGDAGVGKTSLCKHLVSSWCLAHSQGPVTDDQEMVPIMKQFDFLFYVTLRHAKDQFKINEMIVTQLLDQTLKQSSIKDKSREQFLEEFFEQYSKRCLIVLDGLDEWTAPRDSALPSVSNGLPGRSLLMNYTIVTTTRPWKLAALRLQDTEVDKMIKLRGVEKVENFAKKLIEIYKKHHNRNKKHHNRNKKYADFERQLELEGLSEMKDTPILLKQLLCLWYNGHSFGKSKTDVYTNMVKLLFELAEGRENVTMFKVQGNYFEVDSGETHTCFKKGGTCEKYKKVLLKLGELAFETMFSCDNNTQLVFESSEVEKNNIHKKDIDTCVIVGVLTRSIVPDMTRHRESLSFLHKTFHEYFAALYMSVYHSDISDLETRVSQKCRSRSSMFDMRDMFLFLSGMCPSVMKSLSGCLVEAINNDKMVQYNRNNFDWLTIFYEKTQSMILSFCKESSNNCHGPLYLPVPDIHCGLHTFLNDKTATLMQCLQHYPSQLRSIFLTNNKDALNRMSPYSQWLADASSQCTEKSQYHIDLSKYSNLSSVAVTFDVVSQVVLTLNTDHLTYLCLDKVSSSWILPTIKSAESLITLKLSSVRFNYLKGCNERCEINLSEHSRLINLTLNDMSVESVTLSPSIRYIALIKINLQTHDGMCSLMSSLSNAHSLEHIYMTAVKCVEHDSGMECRYEINLSEHSRLETLALYGVSVGSVTLSPSIRFIQLSDINTLSHDSMCSLMPLIDNIPGEIVLQLR